MAVDLADVATSYVLNASKLHEQEQRSEQLQGELESRVVIERAKGITAQRRSVSVDHPYQLMRGHLAVTTPACARSLRRSLVWDFRSERGGLQKGRPATRRHAP
jgi:hypothetical protein